MWNDPIVEEVREARDAHAKQFKYDLKAIAADLKQQQELTVRNVVSLPAKKPVLLPKTKASQDK